MKPRLARTAVCERVADQHLARTLDGTAVLVPARSGVIKAGGIADPQPERRRRRPIRSRPRRGAARRRTSGDPPRRRRTKIACSVTEAMGSATGVHLGFEQARSLRHSVPRFRSGLATFGVPGEDGGTGRRDENPGIASAFGCAERRKQDRRVSPVRTGPAIASARTSASAGGRLRSVSRTNMVGRGGAMKAHRASHRRSQASIRVARAARSRPWRGAADVDRGADDRPAAFGQVRDTVGRQRFDQARLVRTGRPATMWRRAAMADFPASRASRRKMAERRGQASSGQPATSPARSSWPSARRPRSTP